MTVQTDHVEIVDAELDSGRGSRSQSREALSRFIRQPLSMIASVVLLAIIGIAFIYPYFYRWGPTQIDDYKKPGSQQLAHLSLHPGQAGHPLGTDATAYDLLARMMQGTKRDIVIVIVSTVTALVIGILIGALAGYFGSLTDNLLMRFVDVMLSVPSLVILIVVSNKYKGLSGNAQGLALLIGLFAWMGLSRLVRAQFLALKEREFIEAAHAMGASNKRIIFKHLVPNSLGTILVFGTLLAATAIIAETSLTFLGYGVQPPDTSLGQLISVGVDAANTRPWLFYYPGLLILVIVLAISLIGDGVRNAFDPKHNKVRD